MNVDNRRLREIQRYKSVYQGLMDNSESISDILYYEEKIKELTKEEKEILRICDVRI